MADKRRTILLPCSEKPEEMSGMPQNTSRKGNQENHSSTSDANRQIASKARAPADVAPCETKEGREGGRKNYFCSEAQVLVNRRNALKSTGPKDASLTRFNAMKHGLTAERLVVLPFEQPAEYEALLEALRHDLRPEDSVQMLLVQQICASHWRRQRLIRKETMGIADGLRRADQEFSEQEKSQEKRLESIIMFEMHKEIEKEYATWKRYEGWRRKQPLEEQIRLKKIAQNPPPVNVIALSEARRALKEQEETRRERRRLYVQSRFAPISDAMTIRYESSLERQFYRALMMLIKVKSARQGPTTF